MLYGNTSLLFRGAESVSGFGESVFGDLNIDQMIGAATDGLDEYGLGEIYRKRPTRAADVEFRLGVSRELWDDGVRDEIGGYLSGLATARRYMRMGDAVKDAYVRGKWKLDAAAEYVRTIDAMRRRAMRGQALRGGEVSGRLCDSARRETEERGAGGEAERLARRETEGKAPHTARGQALCELQGLAGRETEDRGAGGEAERLARRETEERGAGGEAEGEALFCSEGLARFFEWLLEYAETDEYKVLRDNTLALAAAIDGVSYALAIDIGRGNINVREDPDAGDACADIRRTFARYGLGGVGVEIIAFADTNMNMLELQFLAALHAYHPDIWEALEAFDSRINDFFHYNITRFEREAHFFISYISFMKTLQKKGYPIAIPRYTADRSLTITGGYDAALAHVRTEPGAVVKNDFSIRDGERVFVLTGPNQGGKTTFSRMLGQVLYFSSLGLPAPCASADLPQTSGLCTHFNVEEDPGGGSGRLREELKRLWTILAATPDGGVVLVNELFSSATALDALEMGKRVMRLFADKNCICLYITHLFELASEGGAVSLIAEMTEGPPPVSTYRILRAPSEGNAHAVRLLAGRGLRAQDIKRRIYAAISAQK